MCQGPTASCASICLACPAISLSCVTHCTGLPSTCLLHSQDPLLMLRRLLHSPNILLQGLLLLLLMIMMLLMKQPRLGMSSQSTSKCGSNICGHAPKPEQGRKRARSSCYIGCHLCSHWQVGGLRACWMHCLLHGLCQCLCQCLCPCPCLCPCL